MNIAFAGLRHGHIFTLARLARENPDVTITGYWEENEAVRETVQSSFTEPAYPSYEALLADPQVDIVAIGDYYGIRGQRILKALQAGKHVLSDKPLCTSLDELREIEALSTKKGLKVGCMLDLRYDPALRLAQQLIQRGDLGEIRTLAFTGQHPLQWGTRPMWYFEEGKHGGTFNDISIHGIDAVQMVTGLAYAKTNYTKQWNAFAKEAPQFCDCAQFVGEMENGASLMADISYSAPNKAAFLLPSYWRFTFWGEKGMLECRLGDNTITLALADDEKPRILPAPAIPQDCLKDLMNQINGGKPAFDTPNLFDSAKRVLELQYAADTAGKGGNQ